MTAREQVLVLAAGGAIAVAVALVVSLRRLRRINHDLTTEVLTGDERVAQLENKVHCMRRRADVQERTIDELARVLRDMTDQRDQMVEWMAEVPSRVPVEWVDEIGGQK